MCGWSSFFVFQGGSCEIILQTYRGNLSLGIQILFWRWHNDKGWLLDDRATCVWRRLRASIHSLDAKIYPLTNEYPIFTQSKHLKVDIKGHNSIKMERALVQIHLIDLARSVILRFQMEAMLLLLMVALNSETASAVFHLFQLFVNNFLLLLRNVCVCMTWYIRNII